MNKLILATATLMTLSFGGNVAQAADMPVKAVPVPVWSWSGCYVGVQAGYKWGRSGHVSDGFTNGVANAVAGAGAGADITGRFNVNGALGGGEAGCQYQWGTWVVGVELDGSWSAAEGQANNIPTPGGDGFSATWISKTSERWLVTARGRLGYAWDKWLWYVTGGGAWTGLDIATFSVFGAPAQNAIERHTRGGWVVGYGTEYHVSHGWSVKAESLYADFGTFRALDFVAPTCTNNPNCSNRDVRMYEWIWRVGMNYKFDWYTPIVAKY